jgi:plasmid stability protein
MSSLITASRHSDIKPVPEAPIVGALARATLKQRASGPFYTGIPSALDGGAMPGITIHDIDDELEADLRTRASRHDRSIEDEAREALDAAESNEDAVQDPRGLADAIRARIDPLGGVDLDLPVRRMINRHVDLDA